MQVFNSSGTSCFKFNEIWWVSCLIHMTTSSRRAFLILFRKLHFSVFPWTGHHPAAGWVWISMTLAKCSPPSSQNSKKGVSVGICATLWSLLTLIVKKKFPYFFEKIFWGDIIFLFFFLVLFNAISSGVAFQLTWDQLYRRVYVLYSCTKCSHG